MEQLRTFIAIELPENVKSGIEKLQAQLKCGSHAPVKWVDPYSIHLTLKFLGWTADSKIDDIARAIDKAVRGFTPFCLELSGLGAFPNLNRVRVVWVGIKGDITLLNKLQQRVEEEVSPLGFPGEAHGFTPHLTLGRMREQSPAAEQQTLGRLIKDTLFAGDCRFRVDAVSLIKSQLTPDGAIYSRLRFAVLK